MLLGVGWVFGWLAFWWGVWAACLGPFWGGWVGLGSGLVVARASPAVAAAVERRIRLQLGMQSL